MSHPVWIGAADIERLMSPDTARRLIEAALLSGLDPALDPPRTSPSAGRGNLLLMPASTGSSVGVKVASVAPENPARGLPRIQAWYVLMDAETLTPRVLLDGTAITTLRTAAVSAVAVDRLAPAEIEHVVLVGSGPQALAHAAALRDIRSVGRATVLGRDPTRAAALVDRLRRLGLRCDAARRSDGVVRDAAVVICATSAKDPVIDGADVADGACVVAVGSHEPDRRELDAQLLGRSLVVVEDRATALREAGDIVLAIDEGPLRPESLGDLGDVVNGRVARRTDRPNVFKSVGMSWEDVVIAEGLAAAHAAAHG